MEDFKQIDTMKKTLLLIIFLMGLLAVNAQVNIPYQKLHYRVHYHLGPIHVHIANGTATIESNGNQLRATLAGESIPWEGHIFCVSDTLYAKMNPSNEYSKETVTYEHGWYRKPKSAEFKSGSFDSENPANYKSIKGQGSLDASPQTMEAITVTADMLGLYYFYHEIDFDRLDAGQSITIPITREDGSHEKAVINYYGKTTYNVNGNQYPVYELTYEFTYNGTLSGYPVKTYVGQYDRIPLYMSASLPIGHVEMIYTN